MNTNVTLVRVVGSAMDLAILVAVAILLVVTPSEEALDAMPPPMPPGSLSLAGMSRSGARAPARAANTVARSAPADVPTLAPGTDVRVVDAPLPRIAATSSSGELPSNGVRRTVYRQSQSDDLRDYILGSAAALQRRAWVGHGTTQGNTLASAGATDSD